VEEKKLKYQEWLYQSDYDFETAEFMLQTKRNVYCVFMCYLCLEKVFKAVYIKKLNLIPPKIHNLRYFINKLEIELLEEDEIFISEIDKLSIVTRYPEDLRKMISEFSDEYTKSVLKHTKKIQEWTKEQLI